MEVISIERSTNEELLTSFNSFVTKIESRGQHLILFSFLLCNHFQSVLNFTLGRQFVLQFFWEGLLGQFIS